jgi:hypothetical protein
MRTSEVNLKTNQITNQKKKGCDATGMSSNHPWHPSEPLAMKALGIQMCTSYSRTGNNRYILLGRINDILLPMLLAEKCTEHGHKGLLMGGPLVKIYEEIMRPSLTTLTKGKKPL